MNRIKNKAKDCRKLLDRHQDLHFEVRDAIYDLYEMVELLADALGSTSKTSHRPPSQDSLSDKSEEQNKKKGKSKQNKGKSSKGKKPGGQPGHKGVSLQQYSDPDEIQELKIDRRKLPKGKYNSVAIIKRQVVDIEIERKVTEYQAEVVEDERGNRFAAEFPAGVDVSIQYGDSTRIQALILGTKHAMPYERLSEYMKNQYDIPVSTGTLCNWEALVAKRLEISFVPAALRLLAESSVCGFDETGISVAGELAWAHEANNGNVMLFLPSEFRGKMGMDEFGVLPHFKGTAVHDHWHSYFQYLGCTHALCNAHHLRDLKKIAENDEQSWAQEMAALLNEMNSARKRIKRTLSRKRIESFEHRYDEIVKKGLFQNPGGKQKGKRRSKARCLLDRLRDFKPAVLRFLYDRKVPFSNNDTERPIRMLKVEMKISGTFKSLKTARRSLIIRSYVQTCKNFGISEEEAFRRALHDDIPNFEKLTQKMAA